MTTYYKVLVDNQSCHGGNFDWSDYLPTPTGPGQWTPPVDNVRVCNSGWHLTTDPMQWPKVGMQVYLAEGDGTPSVRNDKAAFQSVRLLEPADHVIPDYWRDVEAFVRELPDIPWLQPQVDTLPDQINGTPSRLFETRNAARDAARDVARAAAWAAAWDAARDVARAAAWAAAWDVTRAAAWDVTRAAAWDAALMASVLVCDGLPLDQEHIDHATARMEVWRLGYGVLCDVDGALYCYRRTQ